MSRTMYDLERDMLALAEAVGVMTIPNPKPRTIAQRVDHVANIAYDAITKMEDMVGRVVVRETYVGRHRAVDEKKPARLKPLWNRFADRTRKVLRPVMAVGARIGCPLLAALERITRKSKDEAAQMNRLHIQMDRARRDISFFHHVINLPLEA